MLTKQIKYVLLYIHSCLKDFGKDPGTNRGFPIVFRFATALFDCLQLLGLIKHIHTDIGFRVERSILAGGRGLLAYERSFIAFALVPESDLRL